MPYLENYKTKIVPTFKHYIFLFAGITVVLYLDFFLLEKVSMLALYSVPLVLTGIYFPKKVAYITGLVSWTLGLLAEVKYLENNDLFFRYTAIGVLFLVILWISFRFNEQTKKLEINNQKLHSLVLNIVESLSSAIEAKDVYLKGHSKNVAEISKEIATTLDLSIKEKTNIYYAALLHDIGKIGISELILNKPGRLTEQEYSHVKEHSEIGATIVNQIKEFEPFVKYVKYHHERWDGFGYPHQLKGEEIPVGASIIAVADAFDAMVSKRSYRNPLSTNLAIEEIRSGSGTQFNPKVVSAFLECIYNQNEIKKSEYQINAS